MSTDELRALADRATTIDAHRPDRLSEVHDRIRTARRRRAAAAVATASGLAVVVMVIVSGAGPVRSDDRTQQPIHSLEPSPSPTGTEQVPHHSCERLSPALTQAIIDGARPGTEMKAVEAASLQAWDLRGLWFVVVRFSGNGVDDEVGLWSVEPSLRAGSLIQSVDLAARDFTVFPDARVQSSQSAHSPIHLSTDEAYQAYDCVGG